MATNSEIRQWARDRGVDISDRGPIPADLRAEYERARPGRVLQPFPKPSEVDDLPPEEFDLTIDVDEPGPSSGPPPSPPGGGGGAPEPGDDEPPRHSTREWRGRTRTRTKAKTAPRLTAGVRGDINAKISLGAEVLARFWESRDPFCGGTAVQQRPEIAEAFTDIVCDSPDMVAWFTGPAGGFMKWFKLAAAFAPVGSAYMAHHVYHTVETPEQAQPDLAQYAA